MLFKFLVGGHLRANVCSEPWPHVAPAEVVAVHYVGRLICTFWVGSGEDRQISHQRCIAGVIISIPIYLVRGHLGFMAKLFADYEVHCIRQGRVHAVGLERGAYDGLGTETVPAPTLALCFARRKSSCGK
jgi:hypothetical protein